MITLNASGGSVTFTFSGNSTYLNDGTITVPVNSLALIIDESDMVTFRKSASADIFVSANIAEFGMTKAELESWYKANMVGSTGGGGGITSGEVQTMIDEAISGITVSGVTEEELNEAIASAKTEIEAEIPTVPTSNTAFTNDAGYITSGEAQTQIDNSISGKVDTTTYTAYTTATDTALASKQTTLTAGTGISIVDNVISATGGGGITSGEVQTMIDESISGKTNKNDNLFTIRTNVIETVVITGGSSFRIIFAFDIIQNNQIVLSTDTVNDKSSLLSALATLGFDNKIYDISGANYADDTSNTSYFGEFLGHKCYAVLLGYVPDFGSITIGLKRGDVYYTLDAVGSGKYNYNLLSNKPTVPTSASQLTNDIGYITSGDAQTQIDESISGKVETSAITSAVTSASTDSEIPTAKAVFDAIPTGGTGGLDTDTERLLSTALVDLNDRKADRTLLSGYQKKGDYATKSQLDVKANASEVMTLDKSKENELITAAALNSINERLIALETAVQALQTLHNNE